jgi:GT2 family glycosyltransferase
MVETAEKHKKSIVGALLLLWDTPHRLFQVAPVWDTWNGGWRHWYHQTVWTVPEKPWKVDVIVGNCVLIPAEAVQAAGFMDSKKYPNFGDVEYTPRMKRMGWELLIEPRARVFCQPNDIPKGVVRTSFLNRLNMLFLDKRAPGNLRRRFRSMWDTAPSKIDALFAFNIFIARIVLGKNWESEWGMSQEEEPLASTFKHEVV